MEGAGERYFDNSLRGGNGIRSRFLLMIHEDADIATKDAAALITQSFREIVEFRMRREHGIALVRPDGYVAYSSLTKASWPSSKRGLAGETNIVEPAMSVGKSPEFLPQINADPLDLVIE